ncbi:hypothetical protein GCM10018952_04840 [Streptosporangium vulgare]
MAQPLSFGQERSWLLHRSDPSAPSCAHRPRDVAGTYREPPDVRRTGGVFRGVFRGASGGVSDAERCPGYAERTRAGARPKSAP